MSFEEDAPSTDRVGPTPRNRMGRALVRAVEETALEFARREVLAAALAVSRGWPGESRSTAPVLPVDDVDAMARLVFGPLLERAEARWGSAYAERLMRRLEPVLDEAWDVERGAHDLDLEDPMPPIAPKPDSYFPRRLESGVRSCIPAPRDTVPSASGALPEDWLDEDVDEPVPTTGRYHRPA